MLQVFFWTILFSAATSSSIALLGQKALISGNLLEPKRFLLLITSWSFLVSMSLALIARFSFIMVNNLLLKMPNLATSATTITTFITLFSFVFIVTANIIFLHERPQINQLVGGIIILSGIWILLK